MFNNALTSSKRLIVDPNAAKENTSLLVAHGPDFDYALESLRGIAAFLVVLSHALPEGLTTVPDFKLSGVWQYSPPGHLSVLVFFLLSGYVIGLTNARPIITGIGRRQYFKKRFVRLYPLYLISLVATIAVAALGGIFYGVGTFSGWLLFLQGIVVPVPTHNQPLWSLGYEVFYYALFLVISARQWRPEWVAIAFILLGLIISQVVASEHIILASYAYGGVFWFIGMYLARTPRSNQLPQYGSMLALMFLMLGLDRLNIAVSVADALHLNVTVEQAHSFFDRAIRFSDLSYLVFCIPLLLNFTNRLLPGQQWLERIAFVIPAVYVACYIYSGKILQQVLLNTSFLAIVFYLIALVIYFARQRVSEVGKRLIHWFTPLGPISYGVYVIHYPIMYTFRTIPILTGAPFVVRLLIYLIVVSALGWLLELRFQPWVKRKLL